MHGITFNDKHSYNDFGLVIESEKISTPSKKTIEIDVPFMNGAYDASTIGSNGEIVYNQRKIEFTFGSKYASKKLMYSQISDVSEWLLDSGTAKLISDDIPDCYFLAKVTNEISIEETIRIGRLPVVFAADPFKYGVSLEGSNQLWDTFNFETGYLQDSEYTVSGSKTITLYNPGRIVMPTINCSVAMSITYNGTTYSLTSGDNSLYGFKLVNGANSITVNGTGTIKFNFRKQVI